MHQPTELVNATLKHLRSLKEESIILAEQRHRLSVETVLYTVWKDRPINQSLKLSDRVPELMCAGSRDLTHFKTELPAYSADNGGGKYNE
ncbi:hypothetical protein Tco_0465157 [Tanacetum coccineum]